MDNIEQKNNTTIAMVVFFLVYLWDFRHRNYFSC